VRVLVRGGVWRAVDGDHPTEEEFVKNFAMAQQKLQAAIPATLDFVFGKRIDEL
jgi:hypothetical protein